MAGITDCINPYCLQADEDGRLNLRLKSGGGLVCTADGLAASGAFIPHFEKADSDPFAVAGPLGPDGIVNPTLPGPGGTPVTSVMSGALSAAGGSSGEVWCVLLHATANMRLLPPATGASECGLSLLGSVDGVNYRELHAINYITDVSGKFGPGPCYQEPLQVYLPGGTFFTPTFVINYNRESAANDADFIKANSMRYWFTTHRVS